MKDLKFTIRDKVTSNKHLRNLRNNYRDYVSLTRYKIDQFRSREQSQPVEETVRKFSDEEAKEKYRYILDKNRSLVHLEEFGSDAPLVSIIITNSNGRHHLEKLFENFKENMEYPNFEVVVADCASTDGSVDFLEELSPGLPLKILESSPDLYFSKASNQAANEAQGKYLLLLNNSVEPTYGWLNQMMHTALGRDGVGAVGAKMVYPATTRHNNSFKIEHMGIAFREENGFIEPYNRGEGLEPFDPKSMGEVALAGVSTACLLVRKDLYQDVGGLDEEYTGGFEGVDFSLKLKKEGYVNIYCPQALLFHHESYLKDKVDEKETKKRKLKNQELFQEKWGEWLHKEYLDDKLNVNTVFSERPLKVALVVSEVGEDASAGDYFTASELGSCLEELGWEVGYLAQSGPGNWYHVPHDVDVVVSLLEVYDPGKIMCKNQLLIKVAWARNWFERWVGSHSLKKYDLVFASSATACRFIEEKTGMKAFLLPIATNNRRFNNSVPAREEYRNDFCFTGSYWDDPRDIVDFLDPENLPYDFKLFGKNWDKFEKFKPYYQGFLEYSQLPAVYASSKIVIDDVNRGSKKFGSVNSRVFDALASGALVITNGELGANETFEGKLPYYRSKKELNELINYYLTHEDARKARIKELQDMVLQNHRYEIRAQTLKKILIQEYVL